MEPEFLITIEEFCVKYEIDVSFINSLHQYGLIKIITVKEIGFIDACQLQQLEKFIHLYYELDINIEGIETIDSLLHRINKMKTEITWLKNKLQIYEGEL